MACATLSWVPKDNPLKRGVTYTFTLCCDNSGCVPIYYWAAGPDEGASGNEIGQSDCCIWLVSFPNNSYASMTVVVQCRDPQSQHPVSQGR